MTDADLKRFFLSKLAPKKPQVAPLVSTVRDPSAASYFQDVVTPESVVREEDMIASMVDIWHEQGLDGLVALAPGIRKMAKALRAPEVQRESVSSFIYPMY